MPLLDQLSPNKRNSMKNHVNVCLCLRLRATVLFDELKQISISIATDGCTSQLNVESSNCTDLVPDVNMLTMAERCQVSLNFIAINKQ